MSELISFHRKTTPAFSFKKRKTASFCMKFEDYVLMPKLRIIVTPEIGGILRKHKVLSIPEINPHNRWRYHTGKRCVPIKYLFRNKIALKEIMDTDPVFLTHGGIKVKLPKVITEDLAYLTGLICGDGNLFKTKKRDYWIAVHNKDRTLLEKAKEIFEKCFGYAMEIKPAHKCWKVEARSQVIHCFFNKILSIENGRKQNICIPEKIKQSRKLVKAFIAGFFDAEGSVSLQKNELTSQISMSQKQKGILEEIKEELSKEGIPMKFYESKNRKYAHLYGNKAALRPFLEKIPFIQPKKRLRLQKAVMNQSIRDSLLSFFGA